MEKGLKVNKKLKYSKEDYIHDLIFPMRTFSDDIDYEKHNLWLIDERLAYHYYLASDIPLNKNAEVDVEADEKTRPDLIIMDKPIAIVNQNEKPYSSVVIVEFKRPMRNDYNEEKDPIRQVVKYVKKIRSGQGIDKDGRPIQVHANTHSYLYIIGDLTSHMVECVELANLTRTPDGNGYFGYMNNSQINAYIEIISFDKLLDDANKRNRILFDKLFKPQI